MADKRLWIATSLDGRTVDIFPAWENTLGQDLADCRSLKANILGVFDDLKRSRKMGAEILMAMRAEALVEQAKKIAEVVR